MKPGKSSWVQALRFAVQLGFMVALGIIITVLVLSLFTARPFCNYFCTGGAKQGLWSVLRIFGIRRDTARCGGCGVCSKACHTKRNLCATPTVSAVFPA